MITRRTEAEWATRRAETIDGLERNWQEEKLLIDEKSRNNRQTEVELATIYRSRNNFVDGLERTWHRREAINRRQEQKQSTD